MSDNPIKPTAPENPILPVEPLVPLVNDFPANNAAVEIAPLPVIRPDRILDEADVKTRLLFVPAQINTRIGDIEGNVDKIMQVWRASSDADLVITPELSITGYPLEDLVESPDLLEAANNALHYLVEQSKSIEAAILVGLPMKGAKDEYGRDIYNGAVLIENGKILQKIRKQHLPNYDVFDEVRNFAKGTPHDPVDFRGTKLGIMICEDTWHQNVSGYLAQEGAQVLISMNSSPYASDKFEYRMDQVVRERVLETGLPMIYLNQVGGQDEIVFDGGSFAMNPDLRVQYQAPMYEENDPYLPVYFPEDGHGAFAKSVVYDVPCTMERDYMALVHGLRDYCAKIGVKEVVLGMSGGLDSALVAAIAADALGGQNVHLIGMPSKFTADMSNEDAVIAAEMLGADIKFIPIEDMVNTMRGSFNDKSVGTADENLQARLRGTTIMWHSNMYGWLPLSTGNKSEVAVGYCTLYGDMNGGFNPLKDVYKTKAKAMAIWRNANVPFGVLGPKGAVMPERIYTRPPSAELAEGQEDTNSLPPYERLDPLLQGYIEDNLSIDDIAHKTGEDKSLVESIVSKVDIAEFKRRQACPGVKITERSFGRGRRYPIARMITADMINGSRRLLQRLKNPALR